MRAWFLGALLALIGVGAHAQCTGGAGVPFNCRHGDVPTVNDLVMGGSLTGASINRTVQWNWGEVLGAGMPIVASTLRVGGKPVLYAAGYGLVANGVTPDDAALQAALTACTAASGQLILPPGRILITGGNGLSSRIDRCALVGSGVQPGTNLGVTSEGTIFYLTSTTAGTNVPPFILGKNWAIQGVAFYHPNQTTGLIAHPALFVDDGANQNGIALVDNVTIVNAYDAFVQTSTVAWGAINFSNSRMFAARDLFRINNIGDALQFVNTTFTPGPWLQMCASACAAAVDNAAQNNKIFHVTSVAGQPGASANINVSNSGTESWRHGIYLDSGAIFAGARIDMIWDGVGTIVDSSSGGTYASNLVTGVALSCAVPKFAGGVDTSNYPCFKMGANGDLNIGTFLVSDMNGSLVETAGASVFLRGIQASGIGRINDGGDYYALKVSAGTPVVVVQNSSFTGTSTVRSHGVVSTAATPLRLSVQNSSFISLNEALNVRAASVNVITGNTSANIVGSVSAIISNSAQFTNPVSYGLNHFDKPPAVAVSACGTGATAAGATSGWVIVGTGGVSSCTITLPWYPVGDRAGSCQFFSSSYPVIITASPAALAWTMTFSAPVAAGGQIFFNCPGAL